MDKNEKRAAILVVVGVVIIAIVCIFCVVIGSV